MNVKVGDKIKIIEMNGEPQYTGKIGIVTRIIQGCPQFGIETQIKGTWGGCGLFETDSFEIIEEGEGK